MVERLDPLADELGRKPFAEGVATLIKNYHSDNCFVVGIEGAWGEGKTYTIELIRREILQKNNDETDKSIKWITFNPWNIKDHEHLAEIFLCTLALNLKPEPSKSWSGVALLSKPIARILSRMTKHDWLIALISLGFIGFLLNIEKLAIAVGLGGTGILYIIPAISAAYFHPGRDKFLSSLSSALEDYADSIDDVLGQSKKKQSLLELKKDVADKLTDEKLPFSRIVVAIEDLDRLTPQEVRSMIQLMRMIADFPKVTYLVGYDRQQVIRALSELAGHKATIEEAREYGEGYLQKVVQAAYKLPQPQEFAIANIVLNNFHILASPIYGENFHKEESWQSVSPLIAELWNTVRDGERVVNRALHIITMLKEKSNPIDVLIASYLMEYQPALWIWIWNSRNAILGGGRKLIKQNDAPAIGRSVQEIPETGYLQDQIVGNKLAIDRLTNLMKVAFPSLQYDGPYPFTAEERALCPIGSRDFLESYFKYEATIASEAQNIVPELLNAQGRKLKELLNKIRSFDDDYLSFLFRDLKEHLENNTLTWQTQALPLLQELGKMFDAIPQPKGAFKVAPAFRVHILSIYLINQQPREKRPQLVLELISQWLKDGLRYLPTSLAEKVGQEGGWIPYDGISKSDKPLEMEFSGENERQLKELVNREIDSWVRESPMRWLDHPHAALMLFQWLRFDFSNARRTIDDWMKDDWKIFQVLQTMMQESYSQKLDVRRGAVVKYGIAVHGLKRLIAMNTMQLRIRIHQALVKNPHATATYNELIQAIDKLPDDLPE